MISPFGVEHGISKAERRAEFPERLAPLAPGTTVLAYNNSRRNQKEAAASNFAAKTGGAALGGLAGTALYLKTRKASALKLAKPTRFKIAGKKIKWSPDHKRGIYMSALSGTAGGVGGYVGGMASLNQIKRNKKRYGYKEEVNG